MGHERRKGKRTGLIFTQFNATVMGSVYFLLGIFDPLELRTIGEETP